MNYTEIELQELKEEVSQMWKLVLSQLEKAKQAFLGGDVEVAQEVVSREKRVDAYELKIDSDCENYIALYSPVAIDLRLVLSLIRISITLERIGDFAEGIACHVVEENGRKANTQLVEELQLEKMLDTLLGMLSDSFVALESENTKISGRIISKDFEIDKLYHSSLNVLTAYLLQNPGDILYGLKLILIIRKLERIGDHCRNIVEEIVFYVDAKVLKHGGKKKPESLIANLNVNNIRA
ncbi:MAG: phosphate signaling complex protein PhoU [Prevotellaceae bacterium]|jgi:phosphate transport system protein|nr:phosphate signaling complex protein PhoU [Prevotellaceae bacterium]